MDWILFCPTPRPPPPPHLFVQFFFLNNKFTQCNSSAWPRGSFLPQHPQTGARDSWRGCMRVTRTVQIHPGVSQGLPTAVLDIKTVTGQGWTQRGDTATTLHQEVGGEASSSPVHLTKHDVQSTCHSNRWFCSSFCLLSGLLNLPWKPFYLFKNIFFRPTALRYSMCVCVHVCVCCVCVCAHACVRVCCVCVHAHTCACACVCGVCTESWKHVHLKNV